MAWRSESSAHSEHRFIVLLEKAFFPYNDRPAWTEWHDNSGAGLNNLRVDVGKKNAIWYISDGVTRGDMLPAGKYVYKIRLSCTGALAENPFRGLQ